MRCETKVYFIGTVMHWQPIAFAAAHLVLCAAVFRTACRDRAASGWMPLLVVIVDLPVSPFILLLARGLGLVFPAEWRPAVDVAAFSSLGTAWYYLVGWWLS